jgi:hypothetical protein
MKKISTIIFFVIPLMVIAEEKIPSKSELDAVMLNAVKQTNAQMAGVKIDEHTNLKFVTYDLNPPLLTYFYTSSVLSTLNQNSLNQLQIDAMKKFNIVKTCSTKYQPLMKPYNLKIAHIFEDKLSGKVFYKLTVTHMDC